MGLIFLADFAYNGLISSQQWGLFFCIPQYIMAN